MSFECGPGSGSLPPSGNHFYFYFVFPDVFLIGNNNWHLRWVYTVYWKCCRFEHPIILMTTILLPLRRRKRFNGGSLCESLLAHKISSQALYWEFTDTKYNFELLRTDVLGDSSAWKFGFLFFSFLMHVLFSFLFFIFLCHRSSMIVLKPVNRLIRVTFDDHPSPLYRT